MLNWWPVHAIVPPLSLHGPSLTIRRASPDPDLTLSIIGEVAMPIST
jgi:Flp pilus assembly CpaF family ATPase